MFRGLNLPLTLNTQIVYKAVMSDEVFPG